MAMLGQFLRVLRNFKIGGMMQCTIEVDHYLKWPRSANVRIFWLRPTEGADVL